MSLLDAAMLALPRPTASTSHDKVEHHQTAMIAGATSEPWVLEETKDPGYRHSL